MAEVCSSVCGGYPAKMGDLVFQAYTLRIHDIKRPAVFNKRHSRNDQSKVGRSCRLFVLWNYAGLFTMVNPP